MTPTETGSASPARVSSRAVTARSRSTVADLTGNGVLDLAIVNGGSGTVTLLPGVGGGFFDDQDPQTPFNLGGAVVQASDVCRRTRAWATR